MPETLHLERGFEFKFAGDGKTGVFSGYGAVFGNVDSYGDVIERGAFRETLREWEQRGKYPPMLLQHGGGWMGGADDLLPVGKWVSMEENSKGLKVEGELFAMNTERGTYLYEGLKSGAIDGLSIGYRAKKYKVGTKPTEPTRTLQEVDLVELSIVTFPANDKARVGSVKSADIDEIKTLSDAEDFLREVGRHRLSKATARDLVSRISKIARREAVGDPDLKGLLNQIKLTGSQISTAR
jgi:HK97 family phage prohead protease